MRSDSEEEVYLKPLAMSRLHLAVLAPVNQKKLMAVNMHAL